MKQRNRKVCALLLAAAMTMGIPAQVFATDPGNAVSRAEGEEGGAAGGAVLAPPVTNLPGLEEQGSWSYGKGWEYQYHGADNSAVIQENGMVKATVDYSADAGEGYSKSEDEKPAVDSVVWNFDDNTTQGWEFDASWAGDYHGPKDNVCSADNGKLKVDMDYSGDKDNGWIQPAISISPEDGIDFSNAAVLGFEMYFDPNAKTAGNITVKAVSEKDGNQIFNEQMSGINDMTAEDAENGLKKVVFNFEIDAAAAKKVKPDKLMLLLVGNNTDYKGALYFDNIRLYTPAVEDVYADATVEANTETKLSGSSSGLSVNGEKQAYAAKIKLADPDADASVKALYQYLKAVGESDAALYGHMEDTVLKAGASDLSDSDTKDITGSLAAINGLDCGGLFSGFAGKYNARHSGALVPDTTEGNIKAAALLSNEAISEGAVMTLSCHMPNFAFAKEKDGSAPKTYDRFDYGAADSYNLKGDCMNQILPGGAFNPQFTAFLDLIAEYADQVDGAVLFRPFHENTGSWFWWGKAFCDAETYKSVFKYTVEYLRDEKDVHNLLYVYGPGSEAANLAEYGERYPGDEFVDMIGFDTYDDKASADESYTFMKNFESTVKLTDQFAKEHDKLFAVTETGITNAAMKKQGNERPEWFTEILDIVTKPDYNCAYYMVWSNYDSKSNYYSPFVVSKAEDGTPHGHELMDGFLRFYNNGKSIFANDQKDVVYGTKPADPEVSGWDATGYITAPLAGSRILSGTDIAARLSEEMPDVTLSVSNGTDETALDTTSKEKMVTAKLTDEILAKLGEAANGKIILKSKDKKLAEITVIFNIPEKEPDPYMVDDFESYYGVDSMLTGAWATNKATGSSVELNLTNAEDEAQDGYAMKFTYSETSGGWAGATITKEVDWSDCNALQFWTIPDGKQQKTVIQIQANNTCYEAYLNEYADYNARGGKPTLVTIPFAQFCQRDTEGNPKGGLVNDCGSVSSFGLWVNAVDNEFFEDGTVSGTIWYDNITAVTAELTEASFADPSASAHVHKYTYKDNGDGTHTKVCEECGETISEEHAMENGVCICGAKATDPVKPDDGKNPGADKNPDDTNKNPDGNKSDADNTNKNTGTSNQNAGNKQTASPRTSDTQNVMLFIVTAVLALAVISGVICRRRFSRR